jgi:hypothetical protein
VGWKIPDEKAAVVYGLEALAKCDLEAPKEAPEVARRHVAWLLRWSAQLQICFDGVNGEVAWISGFSGSRERSSLLLSTNERLARARAVGEAFGMPKGSVGKETDRGAFKFEWTPAGHMFPSPLYGTYLVDEHGNVTSFNQHWHFVVEKTKHMMAVVDAITTARKGFKKAFKRNPGEVIHNKCGLSYREGIDAFHLRPTWVITFRSGSGFVDAETGKYVGPWNVHRL